MKKILKLTSLFFAVLAPSLLMGAEAKAELQRLHKCYGILVGERISTSDVLWLQVKSGTKSGTDACMEVFDKAKLNDRGEVAQISGVYDPVGMKVLNNFLTFHRSQLTAPDYGTAIGVGADRYTRDVIDSNEAAYHFVYSIFGQDQKYSDTVTRDYSLFAKRYSMYPNVLRSVLNVDIPELTQGVYKNILDADGITQTVPNDAGGGVAVFDPTFVETGKLFGLVRDNRSNTLTNDSAVRANGFNNLNINQHLGGGAFGTQSYLLGNLGKDAFSNGGTGLFRRWGKNVMEDFLCRGLPALRSKDVMSEVDVTSKIAFRTGVSCMACHSAMDPLAGVVRNMRAGWSHNTTTFNTRIKFVGSRNPTLAHAEFPSKANDNTFYQRPAWGRIYYRSFDGSLVKNEIVGMQELGQSLAETNDLYVCAAKRYYQMLTGITVSLADIGDINTPAFSTGEIKQRDKVIKMGLELKSHQSIRSLIKGIIGSDAFIYPDKGV